MDRLDETRKAAVLRQIAKAQAEPGWHWQDLDRGDQVYACRDASGGICWGINGGEGGWEMIRGRVPLKFGRAAVIASDNAPRLESRDGQALGRPE